MSIESLATDLGIAQAKLAAKDAEIARLTGERDRQYEANVTLIAKSGTEAYDVAKAKDAEIARLRPVAEALAGLLGWTSQTTDELRDNFTQIRRMATEALNQDEASRHAALSGSPAPDPAEAMRAKCEAIARNELARTGGIVGEQIADAIAALKGKGEGR